MVEPSTTMMAQPADPMKNSFHVSPLIDASNLVRYLVERTFPDGLAIPVNNEGAQVCLTVVSNNALDGVTWVHSYVTPDKKKTFCIYDAPSPEAIRAARSRSAIGRCGE